MCEEIVDNAIYFCCDSVDASSFDVNIGTWLYENTCNDEYGSGTDTDTDGMIEDIKKYIKDIVADEIVEILNDLPSNLGGRLKTLSHIVNVEGVEEMVNDYLNSDYDREEDYYNYMPSSDHEIDLIFNR